MSRESYIRGFVKRAEELGADPGALSAHVSTMIEKCAVKTRDDEGNLHDIPNEYTLGVSNAERKAKELYGGDWRDKVWSDGAVAGADADYKKTGLVDIGLAPFPVMVGRRVGNRILADSKMTKLLGPDWGSIISQWESDRAAALSGGDTKALSKTNKLLSEAQKTSKGFKQLPTSGKFARITNLLRKYPGASAAASKLLGWGVGTYYGVKGVRRLASSPSADALRAIQSGNHQVKE